MTTPFTLVLALKTYLVLIRTTFGGMLMNTQMSLSLIDSTS
jgi:hypothetical protein